jgi:RNA polymerase sigma factor (sigma-70 family)
MPIKELRASAPYWSGVDDIANEIEELYRRRYVAFRNGLLPVTGSLEAARDAVQEGFARALRDRSQYRYEGSLEGWVWRIALRAALQSRRNGYERTLDEALVAMPFVEAERDPELAQAVQALPPRRRLIVFLRYFADLPYADIAELCEISEGTVAAALARAHADLSKTLSTERARC